MITIYYIYTVDSLSIYPKESEGVWEKVRIRGVIDFMKFGCTDILKYWKELAPRVYILNSASHARHRSASHVMAFSKYWNELSGQWVIFTSLSLPENSSTERSSRKLEPISETPKVPKKTGQ